jgi:hypothetical protein
VTCPSRSRVFTSFDASLWTGRAPSAVTSAAACGLSTMRIFCPPNCGWVNIGRTDRICRGSPAISPRPTAPYFGSWPSTVEATGLAATRWLAATVVTPKGAISAWNPGTPTAAQSRAGW